MNSRESADAPLVSCIMPTANRRAFIPQAIRQFLAQTYPHRELLVLDGGTDSVADLMPVDPRVQYYREEPGCTTGEMRNRCCHLANGDYIMHWDDDDWMAPWRIRYQIDALLASGADLCGTDRLTYLDPVASAAWEYIYPKGARPWVVGGTLCYARTYWQSHPFQPLRVGEDTRFVWATPKAKICVLENHRFYVGRIHHGNTSKKRTGGSRWRQIPYAVAADLVAGEMNTHEPPLMAGSVLDGSRSVAGESQIHLPRSTAAEGTPMAPTGKGASEYAILMVVHNAGDVVKIAVQNTLQRSVGQDARLVVVDNASDDGIEGWLDCLAHQGHIDLIRSRQNMGHGPALELARRQTRSRFIVTLDSDAFPLCDDWLDRLRARLNDRVKVAGILHHRNYIHPSCLLIERSTLDAFDLTFLNEKDRPSRLDVAERISVTLKASGYELGGLRRTGEERRGSRSEPIYLGSTYEDLVYHQWYTTRKVMAKQGRVDDVPDGAIQASLDQLIVRHAQRPLAVTVVVGVRANAEDPRRQRNARAALRALNCQDLSRWSYQIIVVEQDDRPCLQETLAPYADRYLFVTNSGPYNRSWAFNVGANVATENQGVLCFFDADLVAPADFLRRGLAQMEAGARALHPYAEVQYLDEASSQRVLRERFATPPWTPQGYDGPRYTTSQGGALWVDADLYREIGGHDELFRGWGCEDREIWDRLARRVPIATMTGTLLHLDHDSTANTDQWAAANQRRYQQLRSRQRTGQPQGHGRQTIGDPRKYAHEVSDRGELIRPKPASGRVANGRPALGRRPWEQWHRWSRQRIEAIVRDEESRASQQSVRFQLAELAVAEGSTLLDVGCGPGAIWLHFERQRPNFDWTGVDSSAAMVAVAQRLFPHVPVHHADSAELPFEDQEFEVVLLRHLLEHLPKPLMIRTLAEAMRVASSAVILSFYKAPARAATRTNTVGAGFLETRWSIAEIEEPVDGAGWQVVEQRHLHGSQEVSDEVWLLKPEEEGSSRLEVNGASEHVVLESCHQSGLPEASAVDPRPSPTVSIIMPTYRRPHTLARTIALIEAQTYSAWELIIVDNAGECDYIPDDSRVQLHRHLQQTGASYARNQGLRYATGDLVCFFDDDDDMFLDYLATFVRAFAEHPAACLVTCGMEVTDGRINYSYATPECCLRRRYATPTWRTDGPGQDQRYFQRIIRRFGWREDREIVRLKNVLCRANADPVGGLRSGSF